MSRRNLLASTLSSGGGEINTDNYLTILALEDGLTASLSRNACQYCVDGNGNWMDLPAGTATQTISSGQTLSFKGNLTPVSSAGIGTFTINKKCNLEGNCMSMIFGDAVNNSLSGKSYAFKYLFKNCTTIIEVIESFLPATTLDSYCYQYMFDGCSNLTTSSELPAIKLTFGCYQFMFRNCTSLTTAPKLSASSLNESCYQNMFDGCSSLTVAPELPANVLARRCYQFMFRNCTSLITAPVLHVAGLHWYCYSSMFYGCRNLNYIKMLATNIPDTCLSNWVYNVSSTGTFVKHPDMTSLPTGSSGIPANWTVENA